jgi:3-oxoacyl-[acyl-carrier-protein] synthase-3
MATTVRLPDSAVAAQRAGRYPLALGSRLEGIGASIPAEVLTNADLEKIVDTSDDWIVTRTGIHERRIAPAGVDTSDLVVEASRNALKDASVSIEQIDALIVATVTPDTMVSSTAAWVQPKLGLRRGVPVFDLTAACSGWLYGSVLADSLIRSGQARHVLVAGAEVLSRIMNWRDRTTCVLFGDGAGASVHGACNAPGEGLLAQTWGADGSLAGLLWQPGGGVRHPATHETVDQSLHTVHMQGNEVYKHAVRAMQQSVLEVMEQAGVSADDIDIFVPHQANVRIIEATAQRAGLPMEKVFLSIHKYGNVSAASIPMALADARAEGRIQPGMLVMTAAFGAGFTWGASIFRW